jgi:hypothetical protein
MHLDLDSLHEIVSAPLTQLPLLAVIGTTVRTLATSPNGVHEGDIELAR